LACFRRLREVSAPTINLALADKCSKSRPVPQPTSRITSCVSMVSCGNAV